MLSYNVKVDKKKEFRCWSQKLFLWNLNLFV